LEQEFFVIVNWRFKSLNCGFSGDCPFKRFGQCASADECQWKPRAQFFQSTFDAIKKEAQA
jgi:hypothetical protein